MESSFHDALPLGLVVVIGSQFGWRDYQHRVRLNLKGEPQSLEEHPRIFASSDPFRKYLELESNC